MEQIFKSIISLKKTCQVIIGITIKNSDTRQVIEKLPDDSYSIIIVQNKAFKRIGSKRIE